jgi:hypothetical protein
MRLTAGRRLGSWGVIAIVAALSLLFRRGNAAVSFPRQYRVTARSKGIQKTSSAFIRARVVADPVRTATTTTRRTLRAHYSHRYRPLLRTQRLGRCVSRVSNHVPGKGPDITPFFLESRAPRSLGPSSGNLPCSDAAPSNHLLTVDNLGTILGDKVELRT